VKILLIDDNLEITTMLEKYLTLKNFSCIVSNDGRNAVSLLEHEHFDAVILDIAMPNFCGFDVLEELHRKNIYQNIFVLTAVQLTNEETSLLKSYNVIQILHKPIDLKFLLHSIQNIIHA